MGGGVGVESVDLGLGPWACITRLLVREGLNKNINKFGGIFHGGLTPSPPSGENN